MFSISKWNVYQSAQRALVSVGCFYVFGCSTPAPVTVSNSYKVVAVRQLGDVAMTAPLVSSGSQVGDQLVIGEHLVWLDGTAHNDWVATALRTSPLNMGDPILADAYFGLKTAADVAQAQRYASAGKEVGIVYWVDARIGLVAAKNGSPVYVLERPLTRSDGRLLEKALNDMKFSPGVVDGVIDSSTRSALGFYLEYRALPYRYASPVISEALFEAITGQKPE